MDPRQYGPEILPHATTVKRRLEEREDEKGSREERGGEPGRKGGGKPGSRREETAA